MDQPTKATIKHAVEVGAVAVIAIVTLYIFRDALNGLVIKLASDPKIVDLLRTMVVGLLIALGSAIPKWLRASGETSIRDYVNS